MGAIRKKRRPGQGEDMPPMSLSDRRCLAALAGILAVVSVCYELTDGASLRAAQEVDKPPVELTWEAPLDQPQLLEAITLQLEPRYFPADLTPAENIAAGIAYLGELLEQYGDTAAALRAYNLGYDDGDRVFADAVLAAAERWEG